MRDVQYKFNKTTNIGLEMQPPYILVTEEKRQCWRVEWNKAYSSFSWNSLNKGKLSSQSGRVETFTKQKCMS